MTKEEDIVKQRTKKIASLIQKKWKKFSVAIGIAIIILILVLGNDKVIEEGSKIKVHYTGTLDNGTIFDSSLNKEPIEFVVGSGAVINGFEEALKGMKVGEKKTIEIPPEKAYGSFEEDKVIEFPKEQVPNLENLTVGNLVLLTSPSGEIIYATITEFKEEVVILDINHPLAGQSLTFEVEIIDIG